MLYCQILVRYLFVLNSLIGRHWLQDEVSSNQDSASSIFTPAAVDRLQDPSNACFLATGSVGGSGGLGGGVDVQAAGACVTRGGEAVFVLALRTGSLLVVKMPPYGKRGESYRCHFVLSEHY